MPTTASTPENGRTSATAEEAAAKTQSKESVPLTERQVRRRFEKDIVNRGFQGSVIIDSDPGAAGTYASHEYTGASRLADKGTRMVYWSSGSTGPERKSGFGIVYKSRASHNGWVRRAYHITRETNAQVAEREGL